MVLLIDLQTIYNSRFSEIKRKLSKPQWRSSEEGKAQSVEVKSTL